MREKGAKMLNRKLHEDYEKDIRYGGGGGGG